MKRKILIIGVPSKEEILQDIDFSSDERTRVMVIRDCNSFKNYFTTPEGGGWLINEEITFLKNEEATTERIITEVEKMSAFDFTITLFIGHGAIENGKQLLGAWDKAFQLETLMNNSNRQLLIIDACSCERGQNYNPTTAEVDAEYRDRPEKKELNIEECKSIYLNSLIQSSVNSKPCILYATEIGKPAICDGLNGLFSGAIIRQILKWLSQSNSRSILTIDELFNKVKIYFSQKYPQQQPRIENPQNFPFTINPFEEN